MTDPVTPNRGFAIPTRGSDVGTWDIPVNGDFTALDNILGSVTTLGLTTGTVTLNTAQAQSMVLRLTGILTGDVAVTLPQPACYVVENLCAATDSFVVSLTTGVGGGEFICIPPGSACDIYSDGTNVRFRNLARTGDMVLWYKSSVPRWCTSCSVQPYLPLNGGTFSSITYAALSIFLGGTTLPDLRGRMPAMLNFGTGRILSGLTGGVDGNTLGATGGEFGHVITIPELATHGHTGSTIGESVGHVHSGVPAYVPVALHETNGDTGVFVRNILADGGLTNSLFNDRDHVHAFSSDTTGSSSSHNNMPPTLMSGIYMIKT